MDTEFPTRLPFKVLDRVRHVDLATINFRFFKAFIQQFPCRTDKWPPLCVFLVSWLLANHHDGDFKLFRSATCFYFGELRLSSISVKIATVAPLHSFSKNRQRSIYRYKGRRSC